MPHKRSKWQHLLLDADVNRWYQSLARGAEATADNYVRVLGRMLAPAGLTPKAFLALPTKRRDDFLDDYIGARLGEGRAGSYVVAYKKAAMSWLEWNGKKVGRKIKVPNASHAPTLATAQIPTQERLREVLNAADARARLVTCLIAQAGFRPEVLGNYRGTDGLRLGDFPDLEIRGQEIVLKHVPTRITVQGHLSKTRRRYFSFLGPEGCQYLVAYLRERLAAGEELGPQSPLITPRKVRKPFMRSLNISDIVRPVMRRVGIQEPPYIWRSYFSSRCMLAESKGLQRDWREFFMGHSGGISAIYNLQKVMTPDTIEAMRKAYAAARPFLETQPQNGGEDPLLEMAAVLLQSTGMGEEEIRDLDLGERSQQELVELLRDHVVEPIQARAAGPRQRLIPAQDLPRALEDGWVFRSQLLDGRVLVEAAS